MRRLAERLECPEGVTRFLTDVFGVNRFGEPLFRIIWGQTETMQVAGRWGYEDKLIGHNQPCWILQRWMPPELYGTPEMYYTLTADPGTGLAMLGEYPEQGRYETIVMLQEKRYDSSTGQLIIETIPLNEEIVERLMYVCIAAQEMTAWERKAAQDAQEAYDNTQAVAKISDRLFDSLPSFYGPTSYANMRNRTSLIDRKASEIEQQWKQMNLRRQPVRGMFQKPN